MISNTKETQKLDTQAVFSSRGRLRIPSRGLFPIKEHKIKGFLGKGWYDIEESQGHEWAWSKKEAFLHFPRGHKGFSIELQGCTDRHKTPLTISVYELGGRLIGNYITSQLPNNQIDIPSGISDIKIRVSQLWRPEEKRKDKASDKRLLGISIQSVKDLKGYQDMCGWPPVIFEIETTRLCNMRPPCVMCCKSLYDDKPSSSRAPLNIINKFATYLKGANFISLHGLGEPLLCKNLFDILAIAGQKPYTMFNTNGLLLSKQKSKELISKGLKEINFSIDAAYSKTYDKIRKESTFIRLKDNIKYLAILKKAKRSSYPIVIINMTLMEENIMELPAFVDLAYELDAERVMVELLNPMIENFIVKRGDFCFDYHDQMINNRLSEFKGIIDYANEKAKRYGILFTTSNDALTQLLAEKEQSSQRVEDFTKTQAPAGPICKRPWERAMIDIDGGVRICCHLRPKNSASYLIIGNLYKQTFEEIWNGSIIRRIRRQFLNNIMPNECWACPYGYRPKE